jgi:hypothetical protein
LAITLTGIVDAALEKNVPILPLDVSIVFFAGSVIPDAYVAQSDVVKLVDLLLQ